MKRTFLKTFTVLWLFGMYLVLIMTFMAAYQSPSKTVSVAINHYQEANVEFFMLLGSLFITTAGALMLLIDIRGDLKSRVMRRFGPLRAT
jgi:hypothetical protein